MLIVHFEKSPASRADGAKTPNPTMFAARPERLEKHHGGSRLLVLTPMAHRCVHRGILSSQGWEPRRPVVAQALGRVLGRAGQSHRDEHASGRVLRNAGQAERNHQEKEVAVSANPGRHAGGCPPVCRRPTLENLKLIC